MRQILAMMHGYSAAKYRALAKSGKMGLAEAEQKIGELRQAVEYADSALSRVRLSAGGGFEGPETKLGEVMTSADFQYAIEEFVQRQMVPAYQEKMFDFEPLVKPDELPNFMPVTRYQRRQGLPNLRYTPWGQTGPDASFPETDKKQYRVYQWRENFHFGMDVFVNDDLGYIEQTAGDMGRAARRSQEMFVSNMINNATTRARLTGLGALYSGHGRFSVNRWSEVRMAFNQRTDAAGNPIAANATYLVHHAGLADQVNIVRSAQYNPDLMTREPNVVRGTFTPIEDPFMSGTAPDLPWYGFSDWRQSGVTPFVLARWRDLPAPIMTRKQSDNQRITSIMGGGALMPTWWGDWAQGMTSIAMIDIWGTYIDGTEGNLYDYRGGFYSDGTIP